MVEVTGVMEDTVAVVMTTAMINMEEVQAVMMAGTAEVKAVTATVAMAVVGADTAVAMASAEAVTAEVVTVVAVAVTAGVVDLVAVTAGVVDSVAVTAADGEASADGVAVAVTDEVVTAWVVAVASEAVALVAMAGAVATVVASVAGISAEVGEASEVASDAVMVATKDKADKKRKENLLAGLSHHLDQVFLTSIVSEQISSVLFLSLFYFSSSVHKSLVNFTNKLSPWFASLSLFLVEPYEMLNPFLLFCGYFIFLQAELKTPQVFCKLKGMIGL